MLQEKNKTRVRARKTITSGEGARTHTTARTCTPVLDCNRNSSLCLSFASYACFLAQIHDVPLLVPNVKKIAHPHPVYHFAGDSTCCLKSSETSNNFYRFKASVGI